MAEPPRRHARPKCSAWRRWLTGALLLLLPGASTAVDLTALPLEQLLDMRVTTASRYEQNLRDAPGAAQVITATDIQRHGWRSLAQALDALPGLYLTDDRQYQGLGVRGFRRPGDFNTRLLLLVDGIRSNDAVYDQALLGPEFSIDLRLVERIEFLPGPASALYGGNALLGVINVITRSGGGPRSLTVGIGGGNLGQRDGRLEYTDTLPGGLRVLAAADAAESDGEDLYFAEFDTPGQNDGRAVGMDRESQSRLFGRVDWQSWTLLFSHGHRQRLSPGAPYAQLFNDPGAEIVDTQSLVSVGYRGPLGSGVNGALVAYAGRYQYQGYYPYDLPPRTINVDDASAAWQGLDAQLELTPLTGHRLIAGLELRQDSRQDQLNYNRDPYTLYLSDRHSQSRYSLYLQDSWALGDAITLNLGLRHDHDPVGGSQTSPRIGLVTRPAASTTVKLLYGSAHRSPNAYERFYSVPGTGGVAGSIGLEAEKANTTELVLDQQLGGRDNLGLSAYRLELDKLIVAKAADDPNEVMYLNGPRHLSTGIDLWWRHQWPGGALASFSTSLLHSEDGTGGDQAEGAPARLLKLDGQSARLLYGHLLLAGSLRHVSARVGRMPGLEAAAYWRADASLLAPRLLPRSTLALRVSNLFDADIQDPVGDEYLQVTMPQPGRRVWLNLETRF